MSHMPDSSGRPGMSHAPDRGDRRVNASVLAFALLALVAGVALLVAGGGVAVTVAGILLVGLAGIALVSLVFLVVGQGEDRDRAHHPDG
jgi:hypothetical protein